MRRYLGRFGLVAMRAVYKGKDLDKEGWIAGEPSFKHRASRVKPERRQELPFEDAELVSSKSELRK